MSGRNRQTLLLAILATATLVWSAIHHFGVPPKEMAWLLLYSAIGVFAIMFLAAVAVALVQGLRMLWRKLSQREGHR